MFYSAKRQQYLIDQGYTFKIVTNLCERADSIAEQEKYFYATPEDDRELLRTLLNSEVDLEKEQKSEDSAIRKTNTDGAALADAAVKRTAGMTMAQMSGGSGLRYKETKTSTTASSASAGSNSKRHPLFHKRQRR